MKTISFFLLLFFFFIQSNQQLFSKEINQKVNTCSLLSTFPMKKSNKQVHSQEILFDQQSSAPELPLKTRSIGLTQKRAIVIGASAGMGRALAKRLAADGYTVGLAARRINLLQELAQEIPIKTYIKQIDAAKHEEAVKNLEELILEIGGLDLLVISTHSFNDANMSDRSWMGEKVFLDVDAMGFYALARTGLNVFEEQGHGHLVGFSSIDGLRGVAKCPVYSAAKAFCSRLMEAERNRFIQKGIPITITDIIPGWINVKNDPDYKEKKPEAYWIESLDNATQEIFEAIKNKEPVAYITKRWKQVADIIKVMPDELYNALGGL